jgi:outer membrane receptor protein involved in Fe transport
MKRSRSKLFEATQIAFAAGAVGAVGFAGAASAQNNQQKPQQLQAVVVTGSHIRRVNVETASPVIAVTAQQIHATGELTLGGVIDQLPTITGGKVTPTVNNGNQAGAAGRSLIGLRGLGASRTLVLVDGQRILNKDINSIPAVAVQRIEVLTEGASTVYGSDAIGGVLNIILKKHYEGAQATINYGISNHSDGQHKGASFVFGQTSQKGSILAGVSYNKVNEVLQGARKFSENPLTLSVGPNGKPIVVIGGSGSTVTGGIRVPQNVAAQFGCPSSTHITLNRSALDAGTSPVGKGDFHCFSAADRYNYASVQALVEPQERVSGFFRGDFRFSDNITGNMTYYHNQTSAEIQLAPGIFGAGGKVVIPPDSYYNPFPVTFSQNSGNSYGVRMVPGGNRTSGYGQTTDELLLSLNGDVNLGGRSWTWDVGYNYGHYKDTVTIRGLPNATILAPGVGPSFLNQQGVVQCGTKANPISLDTCTPWDPFNVFSASAKAVIPSATTPGVLDSWQLERTYHADSTGGLFDLPGVVSQLAVGVSYRKKYSNNTISPGLLTNPKTGTCALGSECSSHLQGGFNVKEAYLELLLPLVKDAPFIRALNVTLGDRYSRYDLFGETNNWKVAVEYRPIEDLMLRGTISSVFRAPSISDVFATPAGSTSNLESDPCFHITSPNPACVNVPLDGTFVNNTVAAHQQGGGLFTGSAFVGFKLHPETGKSFDFGAVYSPHFVPGFSISADFWRIYINQTITRVGEQSVLNLCFDGVSEYCPLITRYPSGANVGQIKQIFLPVANLGRIDVKGIDMETSYRLPRFGFGQLTASVNATYMQQFKQQIAPAHPDANEVLNGVGMLASGGAALASSCPFNASTICFFPRLRARGSLAWQKGSWHAMWRMRYISSFQVGSANPAERATALSDIPGFVLHFGSYVYNDFNVGYDIRPINTSLTFGVRNVFDKKPPLLYSNNSINANTDPEDFNVIGRFYWGRVTVKF